jgi:ribosomal protein S18 acetylase RimI-like enzyme
MIPIEIRLLTADDAAAYSDLRLESLEREPEAFGSSPQEHRKLSQEDIQRRISLYSSEQFVVGAFADGDLVGTAGFVRYQGLKERHKGRVWGVYLKAELRGKRIGQQMLRELVKHAAKVEGLEQILLAVAATQTAAIAVYRSVGFTSFGCEVKALKVGDGYIDEEYMLLRLPGAAV